MYAVGFFELYEHSIHQTKGRQFNEDRNLDIQPRPKRPTSS